jgi:hypothetical protein
MINSTGLGRQGNADNRGPGVGQDYSGGGPGGGGYGGAGGDGGYDTINTPSKL